MGREVEDVVIHDVEEKEIQMSEPSPRSTREWGDAERAMLSASCGRSSECDLVLSFSGLLWNAFLRLVLLRLLCFRLHSF